MRIIRYQHPRLSGFRPLSVFPFSNVENEIGRLVNSVFSDALDRDFWTASNPDHPNVDLYEDKNNYYIRAELPGMKREDIRLEMTAGALTVSGSRKTYGEDGKEERSLSFERSLSVPAPVKEDEIAAAYRDGILTVTLPKREEVKPKKIAIQIK